MRGGVMGSEGEEWREEVLEVKGKKQRSEGVRG